VRAFANAQNQGRIKNMTKILYVEDLFFLSLLLLMPDNISEYIIEDSNQI
jgi:hypothetical protein